MAITQREFALQMLAQLRLLDPSVSAEIGTPERKLIDTVAQAISDQQIDLQALGAALDLDSKFGANLDRFLAIFGFARQRATFSQGFVTFSRTIGSNTNITVPVGTQVAALSVTTGVGDQVIDVQFKTTFEVTLPAGETSVVVPVQAILPGAAGNVAANTITSFVSSPVLGLTSITNVGPTTGGIDLESDDELKVRFKNTVFRNLAGTKDQYLALAVATAFTTKANVVGPISRYREYIQVPDTDDATGGNGLANEYTSALSTIPYSKHLFEIIPFFISNGRSGVESIFYRPDVDFRMNSNPIDKYKGDTFRLVVSGNGLDPLADAETTFQPNITFLNVYTGTNTDIIAPRPGDVLLLEYSYMSDASRNDWDRNVTNSVDVYIDGGNNTLGSAVIPLPTSLSAFVSTTTSKFYSENYRRVGEPEHRPIRGNILTPLFWQPVTDLPDQISVDGTNYYKDLHYWPIEDVTSLGGTVRARSGIEWSVDTKGQDIDDPDPDPVTPYGPLPFTGPKITANTAGTPITIDSYVYDKNIIDLQASLEGSKQVTTDVLAHKAKLRYFKFDITVMYTQNIAAADVNQSIQESLKQFFSTQYFGSTIQLSDILQVVHNTPGVDNVRWSSDVPTLSDLDRVRETDINGNPLTNVIVDRVTTGSTSPAVSEIQKVYLTGTPTDGDYTLTLWDGDPGVTPITTPLIPFDTIASTLQTILTTATISVTVDSVTTGTPQDPFKITFTATAGQPILTAASFLTGGPDIINTDFFLKDNELPTLPTGALSTDTLPGLIIRTRAQNTWTRI